MSSVFRHASRPFLLSLTIFVLLLLFSGIASPSARASVLAKTAPTLKVVPHNIGPPGDGINCGKYQYTGTVCHVTVSETVTSRTGLSWYADPASGSDATFNPASGHLKPGQSVKVTITTPDCGGYYFFLFFGPSNMVTVTFACG